MAKRKGKNKKAGRNYFSQPKKGKKGKSKKSTSIAPFRNNKSKMKSGKRPSRFFKEGTETSLPSAPATPTTPAASIVPYKSQKAKDKAKRNELKSPFGLLTKSPGSFFSARGNQPSGPVKTPETPGNPNVTTLKVKTGTNLNELLGRVDNTRDMPHPTDSDVKPFSPTHMTPQDAMEDLIDSGAFDQPEPTIDINDPTYLSGGSALGIRRNRRKRKLMSTQNLTRSGQKNIASMQTTGLNI